MSREIKYQNGQKLGKCIYIEDAPYKFVGGKRRRMGKFQCRCGRAFIGDVMRVKRGETTTCGRGHTMGNRVINDPIYLVWHAMKNRCYRKNTKSYKNYGARGIKVCDEWRRDFRAYKEYIMSLPNAGDNGYSIDRIDNDGNYEPGNMRWADEHTQMANRSISTRNNTGFVGVNVHKCGFVSSIRINNELIYLGLYKNPKEAVRVRDKYIIDNELWEYPLQVMSI